MTAGAPKTFFCRVAKRDDETNIWDILVEVAPEIPVPTGDQERREALQALIRKCVDGGDTWVAVDSNGAVIGFILAKPDIYERFHKENDALNLPYVGVSKKWQKRGIFRALMDGLTSRSVPLTAVVLHSNKSNMVANLKKSGFTKEDKVDPNQSYLRWDPPDATHTD